MTDAHVLTRDSLTFPPVRIDSADGIRALNANLRSLVRQLEGAATPLMKSSLDIAVSQVWYGMIRSSESRRKRGYFTTILPRLIRVQPGSKNGTKDKPILCSGRIVLQLSNPAFDPCVSVATFDAPRDDPQAECTAILSVVDLTQVRNIKVDSAPATTQPGQDKACINFLTWAIGEFNEVFFQPEPTPPPRPHLVHKPPQISSNFPVV